MNQQTDHDYILICNARDPKCHVHEKYSGGWISVQDENKGNGFVENEAWEVSKRIIEAVCR